MRIKTITIIGISIAAAVFVLIAATAAFREDPYTYAVDNGQATIINFDTAYSGNLTIASSLGGYSVTSIGGGRLCFTANGSGWCHFHRASASGRRAREICNAMNGYDLCLLPAKFPPLSELRLWVHPQEEEIPESMERIICKR